jgi:hypothetical protein
MDEESTQRISKTTAAFLIIVAAIFDLAQIASKLLALMGLVTLGGIFGALGCQYVGIDATGFCAAVGAGTGVAISFIPIVGSALATAAAHIGLVMSEIASAAFMLLGYATISFWLVKDGVPIFSGRNIQKKVATGFITVLVDITPLLNLLPGLTIWTIRMIMIARSEDKEKAKEAQEGYNDGKNYSRMRRPIRRHVSTHT